MAQPLHFWIGDDPWVIIVDFKDDDGNAIALDPVSATPQGEAFLGTKVQGIDLTIANGHVEILDAANGRAKFYIHAADYAGIKFQSDTKPVYNRFQAFVVFADGTHTTHTVTDLKPHDPRADGLNTLPTNGTVVAVLGPQGPMGPPGEQGQDGIIGSDGLSAYDVAVANGFVGDEAAWLEYLRQGPKGDKGDPGDPGPPGRDGVDGQPGTPGEPGQDGAPGSPGDPGQPGADGKSAYQVALDAGFSGTEAAWLASLQGPKGATGDPGADGQDGAPGLPGEPGAPGKDGADGAPGEPGLKGDKGDPGTPGDKGDPGIQGPDGFSAYQLAVQQGFQGTLSQWLTSLIGAKGDKGDTGLKGDKGDTGSAGTAATIAVHSVSTGAAGSAASVTNVGTTSAASLDFVIPQGAKGDKGDTGDSGAAQLATANTWTQNQTYRGHVLVTRTDTSTAMIQLKNAVVPTSGANAAQFAFDGHTTFLTNYSDGNVAYSVAVSGAFHSFYIASVEVVRFTSTGILVNPNATAAPSPLSGTLLQLNGLDGQPARAWVDAFGSTPSFNLRRAGGTSAAKTAVQVGQFLGTFNFIGHGATAYQASVLSFFGLAAAENWTDTAQGTYFSFSSTTKGTLTAFEVARLDNTGLSLRPGSGANSSTTGISFYGTFAAPVTDYGQRRIADIIAGVGAAWGAEYISFRAGRLNKAANDVAALTDEVMRVTNDGLLTMGPAGGTQTAWTVPGRNLIINGNFRINQRGYVSGGTMAQFAYGHDRWKNATGGIYTFAQASQGDNLASHSLDTTVTLPANVQIQQVVEASNIDGGVYTLSWTGTAPALVAYYDGSGYQYPVNQVTGGKATFILPPGVSAVVQFQNGTVGNVQLERGAVATPFEREPASETLRKCMRFYQVINRYILSGVTTGGGIQVFGTAVLAVPMRAAPTVAFAGIGVNNASNLAINGVQTSTVELTTTPTGPGGYWSYAVLQCTAEF